MRLLGPIWLLVGAATVVAACNRSGEPGRPGAKASAAVGVAALGSAPGAADGNTVATAAPTESTPPPAPRAAELGAEQGLVAGKAQDVGPAAPATVTARGIVLVSRDDEVSLARPSRAPGQPFETTQFQRIEAEKDRFVSFARGPAMLGEHAYWISKGRLVRRPLDGQGKLEVLAPGARDGTRVATPAGGADPVVAAAFLGRSQNGERTIAKLWVEGSPVLELSPEGAAASSVSLVRAGSDLVAFALEGRTAMTPLHARRIRFEHGRPALDEDVVVWVGGSAQALTEVSAIATTGGLAALLPMEQDATHFGLVRVAVPFPPRMSSRASWQLYPNGLDPAPVAAGDVCGRSTAIFVRPSEARPHAHQELVFAILDGERIGNPAALARARNFADVSLAPSDGGAFVTWVGDARTWGLAIGCRAPAAAK